MPKTNRRQRRPRFSFIIPTLNEEKYIEDCIKSIRSQSIKDYEIIVIDSNSTDNTVKIARKLKAKILYEKQKGPGAARNKGAKHAKGEFLIFADADVRFDKNFLSLFSEKFNAGGCIFYLKAHDASSFSKSLSYKIVDHIAKFMISLGVTMTAGSCFAYRKNVFLQAGGFNTKFLTNEDHELAKRIAKKHRFVFLNIPVFTSARRAEKMGFFKITKIYIKSTLMFLSKNKHIHDYWD